AYVGSNPTPSTGGGAARPRHFAGVAQLVERQPSKLNVVGSSPISRSARLAGRHRPSLSHTQTLEPGRPPISVAGEAERAPVRSVRSSVSTGSAARRRQRSEAARAVPGGGNWGTPTPT